MDIVGRRERFLKSNFESLSGTEDASGHHPALANSISNQYREVSALQRNAATIKRAQSFRDEQQNKKRDELQKRIEETRKKLQNVSLMESPLVHFADLLLPLMWFSDFSTSANAVRPPMNVWS